MAEQAYCSQLSTLLREKKRNDLKQWKEKQSWVQRGDGVQTSNGVQRSNGVQSSGVLFDRHSFQLKPEFFRSCYGAPLIWCGFAGFSWLWESFGRCGVVSLITTLFSPLEALVPLGVCLDQAVLRLRNSSRCDEVISHAKEMITRKLHHKIGGSMQGVMGVMPSSRIGSMQWKHANGRVCASTALMTFLPN